jgi:hypothetical protein
VGGSGSTCFGSHDAQRDNDQSTTGTDDANESNDRWQRSACVSSRGVYLLRVGGPDEEAFVSGSGVDRGGERRIWGYNVTEHA